MQKLDPIRQNAPVDIHDWDPGILYRIILEDPRDFLTYRKGSGNTIELMEILVMSERRAGKGRRLIEQLLTELPCGTKLLWAITSRRNMRARRFYTALGFRTIAVLDRFYQDRSKEGPDAILYGLDIS